MIVELRKGESVKIRSIGEYGQVMCISVDDNGLIFYNFE